MSSVIDQLINFIEENDIDELTTKQIKGDHIIEVTVNKAITEEE